MGDQNAAAAATDPAPDPRGAPLVVTAWLSDAGRQRLLDTVECEVSDDLERAGDAALVAVSTRLPKGRSTAIVGELLAATGAPIVAVTHAGGEGVAVRMMAAGAAAVVAEGNEEALRSFLDADHHDERLVDTYEQSMERRSGSPAAGRGLDPLTGLPGSAALEQRLSELSQGERLPRIAFVRLPGYGEVVRRLSLDAAELLRRRIAAGFDELCRHAGAEIYTLGDAEYAVVGPDASLDDFEALGLQLAEASGAFGSGASAPLWVALGHAGPEAAAELVTLRELAMRALELAQGQERGGVLGAAKLTVMLASSTELEAARRALAHVEERDAFGTHHGERVAAIATRIARQLGIDGRDYARLRLAAFLHDVGKVALPDEALRDPDELSGDAQTAYREHPARGAAMLRASAGAEVAAMVGRQCEHWDGGGFPDGLAGEAIPVGGRVIAVADALDRWSLAEPARADGYAPSGDALARIEDGAGTRFDPDVVKAAKEVWG